MSKMLSTQMSGLFQRIIQNEEESIEETARLLAQASVGQGNVYFVCFEELQAIELNAIHGTEKFVNLAPWSSDTNITDVDRVCIFTKSSNNPSALDLAQRLYDQFIPFAVVSNDSPNETNKLSEIAYTYICTKIRGGLIPHATNLGERVVIPNLMAALFIYEAIKLNYDEMIAEDEE